MDKQAFIERLSKSEGLSKQDKIDVCQYYIDNYPINFNGFMIKLPIQINGGGDMAVDHAFNSLKNRLNEFL